MQQPQMVMLKKALKRLRAAPAHELAERVRRGGVGGMRPRLVEAQEFHEEMAWRWMTAGLEHAVLLDEHITFRQGLVRILVSQKTSSERRRAALDYLGSRYGLATEGEDVMFVFTEREAGRVPAVVPERVEAGVGFVATYVRRSRGDSTRSRSSLHLAAMRAFAHTSQGSLDHLLGLIGVLTASHRRLAASEYAGPVLPERELVEWRAHVRYTWDEQTNPSLVSVPHEPMSTLTRETRGFGEIVRKGGSTQRGMALAPDPNRGYIYVGDHKLIDHERQVDDMYLMVPGRGGVQGVTTMVTGEQGLVDGLMAALTELCQADEEPEYLAGCIEMIPRVTLGIFLAAQTDRALSFVNPGEFVDAETASRLAALVGMNAGDTRSKRKVATIRTMLEKIWLRRSIRSIDAKTGEVVKAIYEGPLIQRMEGRVHVDKIPASSQIPRHTKLGVWRVVPELWRMNEHDSGVASYMQLDRRAFDLETSRCDAFNLYWTIIQRAQNAHRARVDADRFTSSGAFSPTLKVLYELSGLERAYHRHNKGRAREHMLKQMHKLRVAELIMDFDASAFKPDLGLETRVRITLPRRTLAVLGNRAFVEGENPFPRVLD